MKSEWSTNFFHQSQTPNPYPPMSGGGGGPQPSHSSGNSSFFSSPPPMNSSHQSHQSPMSLHQSMPLLQSPLKTSPRSEAESTSAPNSVGHVIKGERCVGCGSDSAIRVHYGASSCHGCKAFFRRSVFEGRVYMCSAENQCDITNESRNRCRACRLRNCLDGGMNPKHVREERSKIERMPGNTCTVSATNGVTHNVPTTSAASPIMEVKYSATLASALSSASSSTQAPSTSESSFTSSSVSQPAPVESTTSSGSEAEVVDKKTLQENPLTLFMCALEKQTEQLKDEDVKDNDVMGAWSRDISLTFGLQHPQMVIKRLPIMYTCDRIMEAADLYLSWYRSFVFCADWAMGIPEFRVLPLADQTTLFKQNFMAFGWITFAYKCFDLKQHKIGIPLGNGSFIPYNDEDQKQLPERWAQTYGVVCKKLIDLIVKVMIELQITEEEYCLIKTISLFQQDCILSETGAGICTRMRDRLLDALSTHIERKFPFQTQSQRLTRALKISLMLPSFSHIGQVESTLIQQLTAADLHQLSGVPMEICHAQQSL
ncbi:Protein CBR-NHR-46 [Caenorhabditis briggsae]|nr:Protein CBR-NHR-46 [Caenorhabditis briggsae]ULT94475.1 hypothetical protein L3Y34_003743 [Caenorhabditis briggsae]UMM27725.1 hypothetical protein L5515_010894 [Caenorhabditis briggsae]CAP37040.2 Protein CBR-NHR-46 [Caenorhabditis briggsae]